MKVALIVMSLIVSVSASAYNLKCSNNRDELILEESSIKFLPYFAKIKMKNGLFYSGAECTQISKSFSTRNQYFDLYECNTEPEWTVIKTVALVEVSSDRDEAYLIPVNQEGPFGEGYDVGDKILMRCELTTETAN